MSNVHEFPPRGPSAGAPTPPDKLVLEELQKIADFLGSRHRTGRKPR
jgi:hypothetical protein